MNQNDIEIQLSSLPAEQEGSVQHIDLLNALAWEIRNTNTHHALELSQQAETLARCRLYPRGLAYSLLNEAICFVRLSNPEAARSRSLEARPIFAALHDLTGEAALLTTLGNVAYLSGDYVQALEYYHHSLDGRRATADKRGEASTLHNIGNIYEKLGDTAKALDHYYQSLGIKEEIADQHGIALSLTNIGTVYQRLDDSDKALETFEESIRISTALGDRHARAVGLNNIGFTYEHRGEHEKALLYFRQAYVLAEENGDRVNEAIASINIGAAAAHLGDAAAAEEYLTHSLALAREIGNPLTETMALWELGRFCLDRGDLTGSVEVLQQALGIATRIGSPEWSYKIHEILAAAYEQRMDLGDALRHYKAFHQSKSEVFNEETDRKTRTLMAQFQVEKAQKEAEIIRLKNVELAQAYQELAQLNTQLQHANEQKSRLLEQLEQQTREDWLTGLYNRRYLDQQLPQEFQRTRRFGHPLSLAVADVDNFKAINDGYSHATGDEVLRQVAALIRSSCRATDLVARYGGDEFALLLPETPSSGGLVLCEKIRKAVESYDWEQILPDLQVTLSLGLVDTTQAADADGLLRLADQMLYEAKHQGRNLVRYNHP